MQNCRIRNKHLSLADKICFLFKRVILTSVIYIVHEIRPSVVTGLA